MGKRFVDTTITLHEAIGYFHLDCSEGNKIQEKVKFILQNFTSKTTTQIIILINRSRKLQRVKRSKCVKSKRKQNQVI